MNLTINTEKNVELKKHVNAIHCSNNLTLLQRKLFNALLFNAYPDLPHKQQFQIPAKKLCDSIGYNSNDYGKLKGALLGLIRIAIEWNIIDRSTKREDKWKISSILASAELSSGICTYEYSQVIKELLYQPEIYGRINIALVAKFKSTYGLALYENCIRYQDLSHTPWFSLETFRSLMGVLGEKYTVFKDFKKRVLTIAINEINSIAPITVFPEIERKNQKVTRIRFRLKSKTVKKTSLIAPSTNQELIDLLSHTFGLSASMTTEVMSKYGSEYVKKKIEVIRQSESFLSGKIRGLAGYLIEALKKDFKPNKPSQTVIDERHKEKEAELKISKEKEEGRAGRYNDYIHKTLAAYLSALPEDQHKQLMSEFEEHMKTQNTIFQGWYHKSGLGHPATRACFNNFIQDTRKNQLTELLSFEDFIALIE